MNQDFKEQLRGFNTKDEFYGRDENGNVGNHYFATIRFWKFPFTREYCPIVLVCWYHNGNEWILDDMQFSMGDYHYGNGKCNHIDRENC